MPDADWMDRLRERSFTADTAFPDSRMQKLKMRMLDEIGAAVCINGFDEDTPALMIRGDFYLSEDAEFRKGENCRCHGNSAAIWKEDDERYCIMTGYAMSNDAVWRQHSWVWDNENERIIETTEDRLLYYGFKMTHKECVYFHDMNEH